MVAVHCPDLFSQIIALQHRGTEYLDAVIEDERGEHYRITVSTYGRELTPHWHTFHCHFDQFADDDHEAEFLGLIDWIKGLRRDEVLIVTEYEGDRLVRCGTGDPAAVIRPSKGRRAEVRSFSGKLDAVISEGGG